MGFKADSARDDEARRDYRAWLASLSPAARLAHRLRVWLGVLAVVAFMLLLVPGCPTIRAIWLATG